MAIDVTLIGPSHVGEGDKTVHIHTTKDVPNGVIAYTEPYKQAVARTIPLLSETSGINANVNAAFSGTPNKVHDGEDSALYATTALSGTWDFASTDQSQAGSASIDATATQNNDEALFIDTGVAEVTTITAVADVSDSLDGTYFLAQDIDGSVAFWIDTDNSGTTIPAGAAAADRAVEITTIATNDSAATIGGLLRTAVGADSKFTTAGSGADCIATNVDKVILTDMADGDSGFSFNTDTQGTTSKISTGNYTAFTGFIYITSWSGSGTKDVTARIRLTGVDQGDELNLSNYIDTGALNSWQAFVIPMADFGAGTVNVDEVVIKTVDIGGGAAPNYYLDVLQFEETGGDTFSINIPKNSRYYITELTIIMADTTTDTASTWNKLLGLTALTNGINFTLINSGETIFNGNFHQHVDFLSFPGLRADYEGNGTNAHVQYSAKFDYPAVVNSRTKDTFTMTISDNLSGLLYFRVLARGYLETLD